MGDGGREVERERETRERERERRSGEKTRERERDSALHCLLSASRVTLRYSLQITGAGPLGTFLATVAETLYLKRPVPSVRSRVISLTLVVSFSFLIMDADD